MRKASVFPVQVLACPTLDQLSASGQNRFGNDMESSLHVFALECGIDGLALDFGHSLEFHIISDGVDERLVDT